MLNKLKPAIWLLFFIQLATAGFAQKPAPTQFLVTFSEANRHEAEITAIFRNTTGKPLQIRMARSSPGRYALHEFAKNMYNIKIRDQDWKPLPHSHPNPHQWDVPHQGEIRFSYTLFGDRADGTYNQIDESHVHLNIPATFVYAVGFDQQPIELTLVSPNPTWTAATQLPALPPDFTPPLLEQKNNRTFSFAAPNLQYFMDSPIELAPFTWRRWSEKGPEGKEQTIEIALHHTGSEADADRMAEATKKIVQKQKAIFGELPDFDYGRYTFIACYVPHASGDGMEHRNSTILTSPGSLSTNFLDILGTVSHEFFHAWNVERIRPETLEPFRFEEANMSDALWLAEGFTSYYGELALRRAGLYTDAQYLSSLEGDINAYFLSPGAHRFSPVHMSQQAPFVDAARSVDPTNRQNTYLSYYTFGSVLAAYLDLTLRGMPGEKTLDGFMQQLWQRYGKTEKPYSLADVEQLLAEYAGNKAFAADFFQKHIYGAHFLNFEPLLAQAGIQVQPRNTRPTIGYERLEEVPEGLLLVSNSFVASPLYKAGLDRDDLIRKINGKKATLKNLQKLLEEAKPEAILLLDVVRQDKAFQTTVQLEVGRAVNLTLQPTQTNTNADGAKIFRAKWWNSKNN